MKRTIFSLIAVAIGLVTPTVTLADGDSFTLKGTINGFEGKYIHIVYQDGEATKDDSVKIAGGHFAFSGQLKNAMETRSLIIGNIYDYQNVNRCYLFAEPKDMTIVIDKDHFNEPKITGSLSQAQMDSLMVLQRACHDEMQRLRDKQNATTNKAEIDALEREIDACQNKAIAEEIEWVKAHPASLIAPMQMQFLMGNMEYKEIENIYANFTPQVKAMPECKEIVDELNVLKTIQPGQPAPLFRAKNWKGVEEGIADLKGKYVLLDFWATWCVPCRKSFPHVKSLYEKYNAKGFDVFCVADDDNNEEKWKAAIEKDGVQQFHHVLRGLVWDRSKGLNGMDKTNDISNKYAILYLPTKYLIDNEGKIIGKFNDEELDAKLKEIFGF